MSELQCLSCSTEPIRAGSPSTPAGPSDDSHLLQGVHHGLQVHALGQLFFPPAKAKKDRCSEGNFPTPVQSSHTAPAATLGLGDPIPACPQELPARGGGTRGQPM